MRPLGEIRLAQQPASVLECAIGFWALGVGEWQTGR